ncbi:MAG: hypothetical protein U5L76_04290 [Patescibacteria group bacterium]|nr:hypothetical protein [Patescibacteria group bacterium]
MTKKKENSFFGEIRENMELKILGIPYIVQRTFLDSHNSYVLQAKHPDGTSEVLKIYFEKRKLTKRQATIFVGHVLTYCDKLRDLKVCLPPDKGIVLLPINGRLAVIHISPFMGESLERNIRFAKSEEDIIRNMDITFTCLGNLMKNGRSDRMSVGIDLIPRNFVSHDGEKAIYVDLVPPKIKVGSKYLLEIPEPKDPLTHKIGIFRHYSKLGVMIVFLVQLCRLKPQYYEVYEDEIIKYLEKMKLSKTADKFRKRLVKTSITGTTADVPVIKNLEFADIYDLREIACYYCYKDLMTREELRYFFSDSHFQDKPLTKKVVNELKNRLIKAVS